MVVEVGENPDAKDIDRLRRARQSNHQSREHTDCSAAEFRRTHSVRIRTSLLTLSVARLAPVKDRRNSDPNRWHAVAASDIVPTGRGDGAHSALS